jgi:hypothetical protein
MGLFCFATLLRPAGYAGQAESTENSFFATDYTD